MADDLLEKVDLTEAGNRAVAHFSGGMRRHDLLNDGAVTPAVGYALLGCVLVVAIFVPLTVRSYSGKV